mmetsp:Transcript_40066/g.121227  ORF Transcript_40066/g.121227 Transcript_40066/m.121227 type:complete len:414 (-) Transcript_40066:300-1541(-)
MASRTAEGPCAAGWPCSASAFWMTSCVARTRGEKSRACAECSRISLITGVRSTLLSWTARSIAARSASGRASRSARSSSSGSTWARTSWMALSTDVIPKSGLLRSMASNTGSKSTCGLCIRRSSRAAAKYALSSWIALRTGAMSTLTLFSWIDLMRGVRSTSLPVSRLKVVVSSTSIFFSSSKVRAHVKTLLTSPSTLSTWEVSSETPRSTEPRMGFKSTDRLLSRITWRMASGFAPSVTALRTSVKARLTSLCILRTSAFSEVLVSCTAVMMGLKLTSLLCSRTARATGARSSAGQAFRALRPPAGRGSAGRGSSAGALGAAARPAGVMRRTRSSKRLSASCSCSSRAVMRVRADALSWLIFWKAVANSRCICFVATANSARTPSTTSCLKTPRSSARKAAHWESSPGPAHG